MASPTHSPPNPLRPQFRSGALYSPGYGSTRRDARIRHGSASRVSDPMAAEATQRVGQRRVRTPSPNVRPDRRGGGLVAAEWQDQIDGLQQQIGTLNHTLSKHAHELATLGTAMQSGDIPAITTRIDSFATTTDQRFVSGGHQVQQNLNKISEKVQSQLDNLQLELRAFVNGGRPSMPRSPEPPPGVDVPIYHNLSHNVNRFDHNLTSDLNVSPTGPSSNVDGFENPFAMGSGMQASEGQTTSPPQTGSTADRTPPQLTPHTQQRPNDFGFSHHPYNGAPHPHNVRFAPCRTNMEYQSPLPRQYPGHQSSTQRLFFAASGPAHVPLWNSYINDDFKLERKGVSDLPVFDGKHDKYSHWKNKLTDHAAENNNYWRAILEHIQQSVQRRVRQHVQQQPVVARRPQQVLAVAAAVRRNMGAAGGGGGRSLLGRVAAPRRWSGRAVRSAGGNSTSSPGRKQRWPPPRPQQSIAPVVAAAKQRMAPGGAERRRRLCGARGKLTAPMGSGCSSSTRPTALSAVAPKWRHRRQRMGTVPAPPPPANSSSSSTCSTVTRRRRPA